MVAAGGNWPVQPSRRLLRTWFPLLLLSPLLAVPLGAQEGGYAEEGSPPGAGWQLQGTLRLDYRSRSSVRGGEDDADLLGSGHLRAALRDEEGAEQMALVVDGLLTWDADGFSAPDQSYFGLQETFPDRFHGFLYEGYVESRALVEGLSFRVGRQEVTREDALWFDGGSVEVAAAPALTFLAYGGIPVHFYESRRQGDALAGLGGRWKVDPRLELGLDGIHVRDEVTGLDGTRFQTRENLSIASATWRPLDQTLLQGSASWVGDRARRQEVSGHWVSPAADWRVRLRVRHQEDYGEAVPTEFSPLAAVLGDVAPYWLGSLGVQHDLSRTVSVDAGYQVRALDNLSDERAFNREYRRWYVLFGIQDLFVDTLSAGLHTDVWESDTGHITTAGGSLTWKPSERLRLEGGTDYMLYRFDWFSGREYVDDRQYFLRARFRLTEVTSFRARIAQDRSQFGTDHVLDFGLSLDF